MTGLRQRSLGLPEKAPPTFLPAISTVGSSLPLWSQHSSVSTLLRDLKSCRTTRYLLQSRHITCSLLFPPGTPLTTSACLAKVSPAPKCRTSFTTLTTSFTRCILTTLSATLWDPTTARSPAGLLLRAACCFLLNHSRVALSFTPGTVYPPRIAFAGPKLFQALNSLFDMFLTWSRQSRSRDETFPLGRLDKDSTVCLLSPLTHHQKTPTRVNLVLGEWKSQVQVFSLDALQDAVPSHNFFSRRTSSHFLPSPHTATNHMPYAVSPPQRPSPSAPSQASVTSTVTNPSTVFSRRLHHSSVNRSSAARSLQPREGESPFLTKARSPLFIATSSGPPRSIGILLRDLNKTRPGQPPLRIPAYASSNGMRTQACFKFCMDQSPGCGSRQCGFAHLDPYVPSSIQAVPSDYFISLLNFLRRQEIQAHFRPSPHLLLLAGQRTNPP